MTQKYMVYQPGIRLGHRKLDLDGIPYTKEELVTDASHEDTFNAYVQNGAIRLVKAEEQAEEPKNEQRTIATTSGRSSNRSGGGQ